MKKGQSLLFIVGLVYGSCVSASPSLAKHCQEEGVDYPMAVQFVQTLQKVIKANDVNAFAKLGVYPVMIHQGSAIHYTVKSVQDMTIRYPVIMTFSMQKAILQQKPTQILCTAQGAATAKGEIWFKTAAEGAKFDTIYTLQQNEATY